MRVMRYLGVVLLLLAVAVGATLFRYGSLHPCDWLERDMVRALELPPIMVQARIRASFMFRGITEPDAYDCLTDWWRLKAEGKFPEES